MTAMHVIKGLRQAKILKDIWKQNIQKPCMYCDKICDSEQELIKHHGECIDLGIANRKCSKCTQLFTRQGIKRHQTKCLGLQKDYDCPECGQFFTSTKDVRTHHQEEHQMERVKSREICYHWRRGRCDRGDACRFSHAGRQESNGSEITRKNNTVPACKNGSSCEWLRNGKCSYFHTKVGVQKPWNNNRRDQGASLPRHEEGRRQGSRTHQENRSRQESHPRQENHNRQERQPRQEPSRNQTQPRRQSHQQADVFHVSLTAVVKEFPIVHTFTPWRIFPTFRQGGQS